VAPTESETAAAFIQLWGEFWDKKLTKSTLIPPTFRNNSFTKKDNNGIQQRRTSHKNLRRTT